MMAYLQKFNELPKEVKDKIQSPAALQALNRIEEKYKVDLAAVVIKVMIGDIKINDLQNHFVFVFGLPAEAAQALTADMKDKIFTDFRDFLGFKIEAPQSPAPTPSAPAESRSQDVRIPLDSGIQAAVTAADAVDVASEQKLESVMSEKKKELADRVPGFFFSPEDESEVVAIAKQLGNYLKTVGSNTSSIEERARKVLSMAGIVFSSEEIENRFIKILSVYLRGVRDKIDTKEAMQKPVDYGGLGLGQDLTNGIMAKIDMIDKGLQNQAASASGETKTVSDVKSSFESVSRSLDPQTNLSANANEPSQPVAPKAIADVPYQPPVAISPANMENITETKNKLSEIIARSDRDVAYDFADLAKKKNVLPPPVKPSLESVAPKEVAEKVIEDSSSSGKLQLNLRDLDSILQKDLSVSPAAPKDEIPEEEIKVKPITRLAVPSIGKSKVDDIKVAPLKLLGPIDELREMDIASFRRLSKDAKIAAKKILDRIKVLEDDDYGKYIEAVKAWKQSPVNVLYLTIGQEAFRDQCDIEAVIDRRMKDSQDYLTTDELAAVIDLSRSLRY